MEDRTPGVAGPGRLGVWPRSGRMEPSQQLHRSILAKPPRGLERLDAGDIHLGHVDRRRLLSKPVGDDLAGAAAQQYPERVEPGGHPEVLHLRCGAHQRPVVRCEALRACEEFADPHLAKNRKWLHRQFEERRQSVPIGGDLPETEVVRNAPDIPGRSQRLEQSDHQATRFLAVIGVPVGVFEDRHVRRYRGDLIGDQIGVFGGLERHRHAGHIPDSACPHTGTVDDVFAGDVTLGGAHRRDATTLQREAGDRSVLDNPSSPHSGALGERQGHSWPGPPVPRWPCRTRRSCR